MHCVHCNIVITENPFIVEGNRYCCERCYLAAQKLQRNLAEREKQYQNLIDSLVRALDSREHETANHSNRVARYAHFLSHKMGIDADECLHICRGALLHDIGKIGIPDNILLKQGKLSSEEWRIMQEHPTIGKRIIESLDFLNIEADLVYAHHEHFDGSGYPCGLAGEAIPLGARIFVVVDALDAITSDRSYHRGETLDSAIDFLQSQNGINFDPQVVSALVENKTAFADLMKNIHTQSSIGTDAISLIQDL